MVAVIYVPKVLLFIRASIRNISNAVAVVKTEKESPVKRQMSVKHNVIGEIDINNK
jgi:hypothetical protein